MGRSRSKFFFGGQVPYREEPSAVVAIGPHADEKLERLASQLPFRWTSLLERRVRRQHYGTNQSRSGLASWRALLYAMSSVRHVAAL